jgi:hypothetical protein
MAAKPIKEWGETLQLRFKVETRHTAARAHCNSGNPGGNQNDAGNAEAFYALACQQARNSLRHLLNK